MRVGKYRDYLQLIQGITNLAPREMDVIAVLHGQMRKHQVDHITPEVRKSSEERLDMSNINVYIKTLKDKKMLIRTDNNELVFNSLLKTEKEQEGVLFLWRS